MQLPPHGFRHAVTLLVTNTCRRMKASGLDLTDEAARVLAEQIVALADDMKAPASAVDWVVEEYKRLTGSHADVGGILSRIGAREIDSGTRDLFLVYVPEDRLTLAGPLAVELVKRGVSVAFSDYEVSTPDELAATVERGLARHRAGVLVETRQFRSKQWIPGPQSARLLMLESVDPVAATAERVMRWLANHQRVPQV
jgi:hypothetical protein